MCVCVRAIACAWGGGGRRCVCVSACASAHMRVRELTSEREIDGERDTHYGWEGARECMCVCVV